MDRHEQFPVGERPSLDLRVPVGVIEVHVGDTGIVQLTVESAAAADFEIIKTGDRVSLRHPSRWSMRGRSCRIVATVPAVPTSTSKRPRPRCASPAVSAP